MVSEKKCESLKGEIVFPMINEYANINVHNISMMIKFTLYPKWNL